MWYYQNFDPNYVTCRACGMPFHKKKIARKRKCPHCKLDNHGCIPTPRAVDVAKSASEKTVVAKFKSGELVSERVISPRN